MRLERVSTRTRTRLVHDAVQSSPVTHHVHTPRAHHVHTPSTHTKYAYHAQDPYPVINYVVTIQRASAYYFNLVIWPSLVITLLSFGVFFMSFEARALHPAPCTLHPTPCTLSFGVFFMSFEARAPHPAPCTLHPTPCTLHPAPYTLHPAPYTLHPGR